MQLEKIIDLFQQRANRPLSLKEIQQEFDLNAGERKAIGKMLKGLVKEGSLVQLKGGRFAFPGKVNLVVGQIRVHRDGYAFVSPVDTQAEDVFVPARHVRPAMDGDTVVIRLERSVHNRRQEGRVIRVERREHQTVVGRYRSEHGLGYVSPVDPQLNEDILVPPESSLDARSGQMVVVSLESYPGRTRAAVGRVTEVLGEATDPEVEIKVSAIQFNLPYEFPPDVLKEASRVPLELSESDLAGREDLRDRLFVTIDGEAAKDFDDAVAIERDGEGYRLWVAIADVAHYVTVGSELDKEALNRGTSVYFPGACLPMLPEALSNGICSLNPGVDRLVMVAELSFDRCGHRTGMRFSEGVIKSQARLTYTEVAAMLLENDESVSDQCHAVVPELELMRDLAELRIAVREDRGSLDFDLPETQIELDLRGRPESIVRGERNLAHRLIEEFMLAANEAVAAYLEKQKEPLIFRVHEPPGEGKIAAFQEFIAYFNQGISIPAEGVKGKVLQDFLSRLSGQPEEQVISHVLLRSLPQAYYSEQNLGHFGLAADNYCHFTSPIRRYPDLVVHRVLKKRLFPEREKGQNSDRTLAEIAQLSSHAERRAMQAERDIVNLKKCQFVADRIGEIYHGMVTSVHAFGAFVELKEIFVEGLIHVSTLEDDFYQYEEERHRLIGMNRRREFTIGTEVKVRVEKVDLDRREIDFRLVDGMVLGEQRKRSRKRSNGRK